jgi:hypothetical protein
MGDKVQLDATVEVGEKLNAVLSKVFGVKREEDESNDS